MADPGILMKGGGGGVQEPKITGKFTGVLQCLQFQQPWFGVQQNDKTKVIILS